MIGSRLVVGRLRGLLADPWRWVGPAAMLSALAVGVIAATPAAASSNAAPGLVLINGDPAGRCSSGPADNYCVNGDRVAVDGTEFTVTVTNLIPGSVITQVDAKIPGAFLKGAAVPCGLISAGFSGCQTNIGVQTQTSLQIARVNPSSDAHPAAVGQFRPRLDLGVDDHPLSTCDFPAGARDFFGRSAARVADACTPPSRTRITEAKINTNTAFFRFNGRLANHFQCVLLRNQRPLFNASCRSSKPYANPLRPGSYTFEVWGINRAGFDAKPARKTFTIR